MSFEKTVEAIKQLDINNVWLSIYAFVCVIAPGILLVFCIKPEYIESLTTSKLLLLSLTLISPIYIGSLLVTLLNSYFAHMVYSHPESKGFTALLKEFNKGELVISIASCALTCYISIFVVMTDSLGPSFKLFYSSSIVLILISVTSALTQFMMRRYTFKDLAKNIKNSIFLFFNK